MAFTFNFPIGESTGITLMEFMHVHLQLYPNLFQLNDNLCLLDFQQDLEVKMTYHFQAKKNVSVILHLTPQMLEQNVFTPLKTQDSVFYLMKVDVYDTDKNHICTGEINWQLKKWNKVRTA